MDAREVMRAVNSFQRVARQVNATTARFDRLTRSPMARIDRHVARSLARYQESSDRLLRQQASFNRLQRTTANLDRHQFARVTRVLEGWEAQVQASQARVSRPPRTRFLAWAGRRRRTNRLEAYLRRSHEHPAVARRGAGRRLWFEEWRRAVFLALADGLSLRDIRAASSGISRSRRRRGGSPRPRQQTAGRCLEERLRHTIFTHGPTPGRLPHRPVKGSGLLVLTG